MININHFQQELPIPREVYSNHVLPHILKFGEGEVAARVCKVMSELHLDFLRRNTEEIFANAKLKAETSVNYDILALPDRPLKTPADYYKLNASIVRIINAKDPWVNCPIDIILFSEEVHSFSEMIHADDVESLRCCFSREYEVAGPWSPPWEPALEANINYK